MTEAFLRPLVWLDYRLALLFTVLIPLILSIWAFVQRFEAIQRLMVIYWRVSSLLAITVYLMIAALPISFISATIARLLIPVALWFWADLNEDIADMRAWRPLRVALNTWRWAVTFYCGLGTVFSLVFLRCAFVDKAALLNSQPLCKLWLDPPWGFKQMFHGGATPGFLGFVGIVGLVLYVLYFAYFVLVRLGRHGRSAASY